jgi:transcriptional antiterminator RfaH
MSKEWFILQFKPNSHYQAIKNLNQQGFETFLPICNFTSRGASRFTNITRPLFSGYMFVAFDKANTQWGKINSTFGVSRLVTFNNILKPVPATLINNLKDRCDLSGKLLPTKKLKKGDHVKISTGPFTNFIATVETLEADQRIWVLIDLLGRQSKIETQFHNLQLSY